MPRDFRTPIQLPGDPTLPLHAAPKQYIDTSLNLYARIQVPTSVKTGAYTASMNEIVMVDASAGAVTVTLPAISTSGRISVKKIDTSVNVVNVVPTGSDTIGSAGATTIPVRYQDQTTTFQANLTTSPANWVVPYNHLSPASLTPIFAPQVSPTFTGTVTVPTTVNSTDAAQKTYVDTAVSGRVPTSQRGPIGGHVQIAYSATVTPDASVASSFYVIATGNVSIAEPINMVDGQRLLVEVYASGATRTATISGSTTNASYVTLPLSIGSTKSAYFGFFRSDRAAHSILTAATVEP